jgi:hypothetical protein
VFKKHTEPNTSKFSFRMHQELNACFPDVFRTPTMLLECFPNTHGRHIRIVDENYFEHAQQFFDATECCFICIRTEPNSQCAPRTHRLLPEYDPFAPRTSKFIFGKQTEWHSGQCDRAIITVFNLACVFTVYVFLQYECLLLSSAFYSTEALSLGPG